MADLLCITDRNGQLNQDLRELCSRRIWFALSRFESRISRIEMVISDENGPRGGVDKACRVSVMVEKRPPIVVADRDADLAVCVSRVADRVGRTVARAVDRLQRFDRVRPVFADPIGNDLTGNEASESVDSP